MILSQTPSKVSKIGSVKHFNRSPFEFLVLAQDTHMIIVLIKQLKSCFNMGSYNMSQIIWRIMYDLYVLCHWTIATDKTGIGYS